MDSYPDFIRPPVEEYVCQGFLSASLQAEHEALQKMADHIKSEGDRINNLVEEYRGACAVFWAKCERETGLYNHNLRIEDNIIYIKKQNNDTPQP
jgi:hypothetical protein